ncbi:MAG: TonB-dependent receptor [Gammaproteobacteria bacterium]|nr:TonB-dependent receptor [Gammaproteobacteria bacterium]
MKTTSRFTGSTLATLRKATLAALTAVVFLAAPVASNAQGTTSSIRGKVLDASGGVVAGASVVVEDTRSGVDRGYTTNSSGVFLATRLLPGGPYRITVNNTESIQVASISLGDTYNLTVTTGVAMEEIIAVGQRGALVEVAAGPSSTFNLGDLQNSVAFSRDIADVYSIDPRLMVDIDDDGFGINCAGKHPKFNAVTLDGVSTADRFGLNDNGYSTAVGMPFPYDAVEQISVELAPFDVTYGGFSACNINSVTKSGSNEWEGGAFYEFSDESLRGDTVPDLTQDFGRESYDKTYYGFNIGGPIIKDKLFVFAAYEESEEPRFISRGYAGSGNGEEKSWLSQADFDRIASIAQNVYNYDAGGLPQDGAQEAQKYLVRVDWNINDAHNAAVIYNYFDGTQDRDSDGQGNRFEFANHGYVKGAENETLTFKLSSQWTDAFSTELFYSDSSLKDSQNTVGDLFMGEMQVSIGGNTVYLGADDSRQANRLSTDSQYLKLSTNFLAGDHVITAGFDSEKLDIFNIFVQHARGGEYRHFDNSGGNDPACAALSAQQRFDGTSVVDSDGDATNDVCGASGIDRFELGRANRVYYGSGGGTNIADDAAAVFTNTLNALYIQDEIFIDRLDLTLVAGLRYEWFDSSDSPVFNQNFTDANGVRNDTNIDGLDILMPRFGFTWGARDDLTIRGGVGLYSGGNPNVWISNAWSNDGLTNAQFERRDCTSGSRPNFSDETGVCSWTILPGMADSITLSGARPGFDIPQAMVDDVLAVSPTAANDSRVAFIDPNYKQPSEWKFALGGTWEMPWQDITMDFDYLHTRGRNPALYNDVSQEIIGTTALGTPIYDFRPGVSDNLMLTNSGETPVANSLAFSFRKQFEFGLDVLFGYAWTEAEDVSPMTSATAGSNFDNTALLDVNNPPAGNSNWVVPNRFTLRLDYAKELFGDNLTRVSLAGYINEGQPQTFVMQGTALEGDGFFGRHLLYVPTGPSDPNVIFGAGFDQAAFFSWVSDQGLSPGFVGRNEINTGWSQRFDLKITQEIPLGEYLTGRAYLKVYNFGNLLNDDWGKITDAEFFSQQVVNAGVDSATGAFTYNGFNSRSLQEVIEESSLWELRFGIDINFGQ